jgi:hypothetical protein
MAGFIFGEAVHNILGHGHHAGRWTLIAAGGIVVTVALAWAIRYLLRRRKAAARALAGEPVLPQTAVAGTDGQA